MKKTLIASAVSASLMAPVAAQAEDMAGPEVSVYGRIHQGIWIYDPEVGKGTTDFSNGGSRFGIKASSDLGNGLTASAQYEFTTHPDSSGFAAESVYHNDDKDKAANLGVTSTRIGTVGVSGSFGNVTLGNQWGAFYNNVSYVDPTFESIGVMYYQKRADIGSVYRTAKTIKYANSFGPVSLELDVRPVDTDANNEYRDGYAFGATFNVNDMFSLSGAIDDNGDKEKLTALQGKVSLGDYHAALVWHQQDPKGKGPDPTLTQFWAGGSFGNTSAMVGYGRLDMDMANSTAPGNKPSGITWGVYHDLGGGLSLMYEGGKLDNDVMSQDQTDHWLGVKFDF